MRRMELDAGIKNIMVIVPHEDDEILLAAGIMEKALAKGIGVHVVMAGNGDYEGHDEATGSVRLPETLAGLQVLGLDGRQVTFLGYADTGMDETESFLHQLLSPPHILSRYQIHWNHEKCRIYQICLCQSSIYKKQNIQKCNCSSLISKHRREYHSKNYQPWDNPINSSKS